MTKSLPWIALGIVLALVGLAFVFPAIADVRQQGSLTMTGIFLLGLGVILTIGGGRIAWTGFRPGKT